MLSYATQLEGGVLFSISSVELFVSLSGSYLWRSSEKRALALQKPYAEIRPI